MELVTLNSITIVLLPKYGDKLVFVKIQSKNGSKVAHPPTEVDPQSLEGQLINVGNHYQWKTTFNSNIK